MNMWSKEEKMQAGKNCKHLGSLPDTDQDIKRWKIQATYTYKQLKYNSERRQTSEKTTFRSFKRQVESTIVHYEFYKKHTKRPSIYFKENWREEFGNWQDKVSNDSSIKEQIQLQGAKL